MGQRGRRFAVGQGVLTSSITMLLSKPQRFGVKVLHTHHQAHICTDCDEMCGEVDHAARGCTGMVGSSKGMP